MKKLLLFLLAAAACSGDPGVPPTVKADVFGWSSSDGFVTGLPPLDDAQTVRIKVTEPLDKNVLTHETFASSDRTASIPEIPYGENLRIDFEVLDSGGDIIASGATPMFGFQSGDTLKNYRVQVAPVASFAPVASVVVDRETSERKFAWSRFDYRGKDTTWLGRLGHATAVTSDGRVLIVGGGDPVPGSAPASLPEFRSIYDDLQIFDPDTGYFTDLAYDEQSGALLADNRDRLFEPVVFHTLTPLGNDRFLVVGGFTPRSDVMRPVNTIQIIDLNAPSGSRVQRLVDKNGSSLVLQKARGWHTATYRSLDKHVVVAGGVGPQGENDVVDTFELIDLASNAVYPETFSLQEARAQHSALLMADGRTVWLLGGRDGEQALASSEVVTLTDAGNTESAPEANMRSARFDFGAVRMTPGGGELILVAGGFTDLEGTPTNGFEISKLGRMSFETGSEWVLNEARGGARIIELPQSQNLVVLGGRGMDGEPVATAERLVFQDLTSVPPYSVEESEPAPTARWRASADIISTGQILLIGGEGEIDGNKAALDSADIYNPLDPVGGENVIVVE